LWTRLFSHPNPHPDLDPDPDLDPPTCPCLKHTHAQIRLSARNCRDALMQQERAVHFLLHSKNSVTVEVKSYMRLLFEEVLTPFYIFQLFAIVLWSAFEEYYYYAGAIALISIISVTLTLVRCVAWTRGFAGGGVATFFRSSSCQLLRSH
jgi:hypothetical protein